MGGRHTMKHLQNRLNGTGHSSEQRASIVRSLRGEVPPPDGTRWVLDAAVCDAELTTSHPILGARKYDLTVAGGSLTGIPGGQFDLALAFRLPGESASDTRPVIRARFRSATISRPIMVRYLAKGDLQVGSTSGIAVIRIHDLSWIIGQDNADGRRLLTMAASIERRFWDACGNAISRPWLTRDCAEIDLHTEWVPGDS
jgi:hypothetical protein